MRATSRINAMVWGVALCLVAESGEAQSGGDRRPGGAGSRSAERREGAVALRNLFTKKKEGVSLPSGQETPGIAEAPKAGPGVEPTPAEAVSAAIQKMAGESGAAVVSSATKALEGREDELKRLARSVEGDPSKLLTESQKLLKDSELSATARQALESAAKPGAQGGVSPASAVEGMKQIVEKVAADPGLIEGGRRVLAENPDLLREGRGLLEKNRELLTPAKGAELMKGLPAGAGKSSQVAKIPVVFPATAQTAAGPMPPWVGSDVPAPRDPVVSPIPRPEVLPEQVTRITAEFARFDANTSVVTFEENVELRHHEFDLSCQVLIAELKPVKDGGPVDPNQATAQAAAGGIQRAIAKGFVIIEKISPDGKIQVAKSRQAVYDAETGDVVLSDFPQLQDGKNLISGSTETTKIYLRRNGKYEVKGLAEYELMPEGDPLKPLKR